MTLSWDSYPSHVRIKCCPDGLRDQEKEANLHSVGAHSPEWLRLAADDVLVYCKPLFTADDCEIGEFSSF